MNIKEKHEKMEKIHDEIVNLKESPLYAYRIENNAHPVIGEGSLDAEVILIGEAPGKNEAETGKPFCGASGRILDELLESISLPRENVYITNVVKDRPPSNRDPLPKEIEMYAPFLDRQIEIIKPYVIATLGRFSMIYIMKRFGLEDKLEPISSAHGKVFDTKKEFCGLKVIPLYHPAATIYSQSLKETLLQDFKVIEYEISRI